MKRTLSEENTINSGENSVKKGKITSSSSSTPLPIGFYKNELSRDDPEEDGETEGGFASEKLAGVLLSSPGFLPEELFGTPFDYRLSLSVEIAQGKHIHPNDLEEQRSDLFIDVVNFLEVNSDPIAKYITENYTVFRKVLVKAELARLKTYLEEKGAEKEASISGVLKCLKVYISNMEHYGILYQLKME